MLVHLFQHPPLRVGTYFIYTEVKFLLLTENPTSWFRDIYMAGLTCVPGFRAWLYLCILGK